MQAKVFALKYDKCYDKFEETPNEKVANMSKLTKPYFSKTSYTGLTSSTDKS